MYKIDKGFPVSYSPSIKIEKIAKLMPKMKIGDSILFEYDLAYKLTHIKKKLAPKVFKGKWLIDKEKKRTGKKDYRLWRVK